MSMGTDFRSRVRDGQEKRARALEAQGPDEFPSGYFRYLAQQDLNDGWASLLQGTLLRDVAAEQVGACPRCGEPIFDLSDTHCWECGLLLGEGSLRGASQDGHTP